LSSVIKLAVISTLIKYCYHSDSTIFLLRMKQSCPTAVPSSRQSRPTDCLSVVATGASAHATGFPTFYVDLLSIKLF
ncbi:hypothetical protein, partial [Nostoc sp. FACHB-152]|uniref:hypothetical protein n=1 Tax=Nostoc sp. FACHB-152 TaxID=2692837 RepID=UPI001A7E523B